MEENQINVLYVEPKKVPVAAVIGKELESYQEAVGGMIEVIYPFDDMVCIVCNEEGKLNGTGSEPGSLFSGRRNI